MFNSPLIAGVTGLAAMWVIVTSFQGLISETFRGFHDIRLATVFGGLITSVLSAISFAILWVLQGHIVLGNAIIVSISTGAISSLLAGIFLRRKLSKFEGGSTIKSREVLSIAWPLLVANFTMFALTQMDLWILGVFRTPEEVGIYGATWRLMALVAMPLLIANAVLPPMIAKLYVKGRKKELERVLRTVATLSGIPAIAVLLSFIFFGKFLLGFIFGNFYREGASVLAILSMGQFVNVWAGSCGLTLVMTGHQLTLMLISAVCGFIAVVGAICLVNTYGSEGVAGATAFAMILQNILMLFFTKHKIGIWTHVRPNYHYIRKIIRGNLS